jgi:hypothetical protein
LPECTLLVVEVELHSLWAVKVSTLELEESEAEVLVLNQLFNRQQLLALVVPLELEVEEEEEASEEVVAVVLLPFHSLLLILYISINTLDHWQMLLSIAEHSLQRRFLNLLLRHLRLFLDLLPLHSHPLLRPTRIQPAQLVILEHHRLFGHEMPLITLGLQVEQLLVRFAAQARTQLLLDHLAVLALFASQVNMDQLALHLLEARLAHLVQQVLIAPLLEVQHVYHVLQAHILLQQAQTRALERPVQLATLALKDKLLVDLQRVQHAPQEHTAAVIRACRVLQELPLLQRMQSRPHLVFLAQDQRTVLAAQQLVHRVQQA